MKKTILFALFSQVVFAQNDSSIIALTGFVDSYYFYDFNEPEEGLFTGIQPGRHNEFNVNIAMIRGRYTSNRMRATVALQSGTYPEINYAAEPSDIIAIINEANAGIRIGKNNWLDIGVMPMYFGYESQFSIEREVYSSAMNTDYTPYYSMGVRWTTNFSEKLSVSANVLNGWQNIFETNDNKAIGIAVTYRPHENIELFYGNFYGNLGTDEEEDFLFYNNFYARWNATRKLKLVLTFDYGSFDSENFDELLFTKIIGEYLFTEKVSFSFRNETLWDHEVGVFPGASNDYSVNVSTLNLNYKPVPEAVLRLELKYLNSTDAVFAVETSEVFIDPTAPAVTVPSGFEDTTFILGASLAVQFNKSWKF